MSKQAKKQMTFYDSLDADVRERLEPLDGDVFAALISANIEERFVWRHPLYDGKRFCELATKSGTLLFIPVDELVLMSQDEILAAVKSAVS